MAKTYQYTVQGHWPFPTDMLRRDDSVPMSVTDSGKISDLSGDFAKDKDAFVDVKISLTGPAMPAVERWNSFCWKVIAIDEYSGKMNRSLHVNPPAEKQCQKPQRRQAGAIDLTPTWSSVMPMLIAALEDGTETGRKMAREELTRMAHLLDQLNAKTVEIP